MLITDVYERAGASTKIGANLFGSRVGGGNFMGIENPRFGQRSSAAFGKTCRSVARRDSLMNLRCDDRTGCTIESAGVSQQVDIVRDKTVAELDQSRHVRFAIAADGAGAEH